jgi:hypothetical protein
MAKRVIECAISCGSCIPTQPALMLEQASCASQLVPTTTHSRSAIGHVARLLLRRREGHQHATKTCTSHLKGDNREGILGGCSALIR